MKKKILASMLMLVMILTSLSVTGCEEDSSSNIDVGIVLPTKNESRWLQDAEKFESQLQDAGFTNEVMFSQADLAIEKNNVESLIEKKMKVLIICAENAAECASTVEKAKEAGVTVIAYDRLVTGTEAVDYYVTFDSVAVGRAQARYLIASAPKNKKSIPLYLYAGAVTDNNSFLFFQGAWEVLQPKIADGTFIVANAPYATRYRNSRKLNKVQQTKIIEQINTKWDVAYAKALAQKQLKRVTDRYKGFVSILAPNDDTARVIGDVFRTDKKVTNLRITGQDAQKDSVQYIYDGKQSMTVFKDTRVLATDSINMAISILKGETPDTGTKYSNGKKNIPAKQSPIKIITKSSIKKELIDTGYYEESDFTVK